MKQGYVYFAGVKEDDTLYKIGFSTDVDKRIQSLQTASAHHLMLSHCVQGTKADERRLHELLARERVVGEWFRGTDTHYVAWATQELDSIDEVLIVRWIAKTVAELDDAIRERYETSNPTQAS